MLPAATLSGSTPRARITRGELGGSRWEIAARPPTPRLRAHVRDLLGYVEATAGKLRRRELPGPQVALLLEFGAPIRIFAAGSDHLASRYPGGFVAGMHDSFTLTEHDGAQSGLQVNLTPIGARLFFGVPMTELTGRVVGLRDLLPKEHQNLTARLEELAIEGARFMLADEHLEIASVGPQTLGGTSVSLSLYVADVDALSARAVAAGATLVRPVSDEFYGDRVAWMTDPFGHKWALTSRIEEVSNEEIARRYAEMIKA